MSDSLPAKFTCFEFSHYAYLVDGVDLRPGVIAAAHDVINNPDSTIGSAALWHERDFDDEVPTQQQRERINDVYAVDPAKYSVPLPMIDAISLVKFINATYAINTDDSRNTGQGSYVIEDVFGAPVKLPEEFGLDDEESSAFLQSLGTNIYSGHNYSAIISRCMMDTNHIEGLSTHIGGVVDNKLYTVADCRMLVTEF
jgi:hypothetical protein